MTRTLRADDLDRIRALCDEGDDILVLGPTGSGSGRLLRELAERLRDEQVPFAAVSCAAGDALDRLAEADQPPLLLVDRFEDADLPFLEAILDLAPTPTTVVAALETNSSTTHYTESLQRLLADSARARAHLPTIRRHRLAPLSPAEIERIAHTRSPEPLDARTVHAIRLLSWGRPEWALDLIPLAHAGAIIDGARIGIDPRAIPELSLPALADLARAIGPLSPEEAAGALVLAEVDPLDPAQAADLVGEATASTLLSRGVLLPQEEAELHTVPAFAAAAVHHLATPEALRRARSRAASLLLSVEAFGLQLFPADTAFCARALGTDIAPESLPADPDVRTAVVQRTTADELLFGSEGSLRALLLRTAHRGIEVDSAFRARALTALGQHRQALAALAPAPDARPASGPTRISMLFLASLCAAELSLPLADVLPFALESRGERDALTVFEQWNHGSVADRSPAATSASRHALPEVALLAEVLSGLESARHGQTAPAALPNERRALFLRSGLAPDRSLEDLLTTAAVGYGLTLVLTGEIGRHREELASLVASLPAAAHHERWLQHLCAAGTALACGSAERASLEWRRLEQTVPRFLPLRLRAHLQEVGALLGRIARGEPAPEPVDLPPEPRTPRRPSHRGAAPHGSSHRAHDAGPSGIGLTPTEWILRYLCDREDPLPRARIDARERRSSLPLLHVAEAHEAASASQHPAELMRVGQRLEELGMWARALDALTEAERIFMRRRAGAGATHCRTRIQLVRERLAAEARWHEPDDAGGAVRVRLTPREREAAQHAARGLSNQQIATQLGCGVRTAESHLAQARAKLGIAHRRDFARRLREIGELD
ncbi:LuxR C-terminal-related transcriptional regulator [Microbacterium sp. gxy059]|uniref:helix-turn-helix transcriptional regulator n=1 Tax=Microbacterium sp. gxy059 TaxID=2957199 RepID=UPI003D954E53